MQFQDNHIPSSYYVAKGINVSCRTYDSISFIFKENDRILLKLDQTASFIWDQINGNRTIEQIIDICLKAYLEDADVIRTSIIDFITELYSNKVIEYSTEPFKGVMLSVC